MDTRNWFGDLLLNLAPTDVDLRGKKPDEMIAAASWKAFGISTASGLAPGPAGWATILPEIIAVTKIQINLIYAIARYYDKTASFNSTTLMMIFGNEGGIALRGVAHKVGDRLMIRMLSSRASSAVARRIGGRIGSRITQRAVGRWIPFVLAPVFGALSKTMTEKIGQEAVGLFSEKIEITESVTCRNGHEISDSVNFCPECGVRIFDIDSFDVARSLKDTQYFYLEE